MVYVYCLASDGMVILMYRIRDVGFVSIVEGVAVSFSLFVHRELFLVCLLEPFSKTSILILFWHWYGKRCVGTRVYVSMAAREGRVSRLSRNLTNQFWIVVWFIVFGPGLYVLCGFCWAPITISWRLLKGLLDALSRLEPDAPLFPVDSASIPTTNSAHTSTTWMRIRSVACLIQLSSELSDNSLVNVSTSWVSNSDSCLYVTSIV